LAETVGLACYRLGGEGRQVVYAGNAALKDKIATLLKGIAEIHIAPNVQPTLGAVTTLSASQELAHATIAARASSTVGLREMAAYGQGRLLPTAQAAGVLLSFMSKGTTPWRRILYADVGSQS
ncbi:MAG TPA: glutamate mutase L, partial [Anaerolineales bacterium]|nr:glutamate mutase L [Anaerolineales bacterium]